MATSTASLIAQARKPLLEESEDENSFWTDDELRDIAHLGYRNMWGKILDVHGEHYMTIDETNVSIASGSSTMTGVPADVFRIQIIEPRDTTDTGTSRNIIFMPRKYNHPDMIQARSSNSVDPSQPQVIFYSIQGAGSPVAAPTIVIAPKLTAAMTIRLAYNQAIAIGSINPIPGESDNAIKAWIVAWALAKDREDRSPDPNWIAIYSTECDSVLTRLTPRQEQEVEVVDDFMRLE